MKINIIDLVSAYAVEINKHKPLEQVSAIRDKAVNNLADIYHAKQASPLIDMDGLVFRIDDTIRLAYKAALGGKDV